MQEQVLEVPEVHCGHCVSSIEGAVGSLEGVEKVKVDLDRKDVTVAFDDASLSVEQIVKAIEDQGYDVGPAGSGDSKLMQIAPKP
ncbi:MAG TPA: copper ion binding protein [Actinomycetota bacterium]|nr:copper ion binding protein [Actinomycetota bacterium]